jgi:hypothetical protein
MTITAVPCLSGILAIRRINWSSVTPRCLAPYDWQITWNCRPFSPYVQVTSSIRRW